MSASRRKATTPEPSVEPPSAIDKSMFSAVEDICTKAKRHSSLLAIGSSRINLTVPKPAQILVSIVSSSGSGSQIFRDSKGSPSETNPLNQLLACPFEHVSNARGRL